LHDHGTKVDVHAVMVMPDHVHLIFTPLIDERAREVYSPGEIMDAIKGGSAHLINRLGARHGRV
jgi:REP element-mobilizing transposase RayT